MFAEIAQLKNLNLLKNLKSNIIRLKSKKSNKIQILMNKNQSSRKRKMKAKIV